MLSIRSFYLSLFIFFVMIIIVIIGGGFMENLRCEIVQQMNSCVLISAILNGKSKRLQIESCKCKIFYRLCINGSNLSDDLKAFMRRRNQEKRFLIIRRE